jgi:hypothetical protein
MNRHLREEDFCRWIAGERSREAEQHVVNCAECRAHAALMSGVLGGFHDHVHERSEQRLAGYGAFPRGATGTGNRDTRGWFGLLWGKLPVAALLALFVAAVAWLPWHASRSSRLAENPAVNVPAASDDVALLKRVDAEVSRTVPGPMEPLAALIEWLPESQPGSAQSPSGQVSPDRPKRSEER